MPVILLAGRDESLLEGLAQSLGAAGHRTLIATSAADARSVAAADPPLVALIERGFVDEDAELRRLRLAAGGAVVVYRAPGSAREPLPPGLLRLTLAEVALPLERQRLMALIQSVVARARAAGRDVHDGPTEDRPR